MKKANTLILDIETAPMLAFVWGLRDQNIALNQIHKDWHVLAWAAKWLGDKSIIYRDQRAAKKVEDDKSILVELWQLLDKADVVITQNGKKFDSRKLNARFIMHGMKPPSPYKHWDTYQVLSRVADFTSDKLEYYTDKLNKKYKKLAHVEFPGMELWKQCLAGNTKAWNVMKIYNTHDVLATEELCLNVKAWAPSNTPDLFLVKDSTAECGTCGAVNRMESRGYNYTRVSKVRKLQCKACGKWSFGKREPL